MFHGCYLQDIKNSNSEIIVMFERGLNPKVIIFIELDKIGDSSNFRTKEISFPAYCDCRRWAEVLFEWIDSVVRQNNFAADPNHKGSYYANQK